MKHQLKIKSIELAKELHVPIENLNNFDILSFSSLPDKVPNTVTFAISKYYKTIDFDNFPEDILLIAPVEFEDEKRQNTVYVGNPLKVFVHLIKKYLRDKHTQTLGNIHRTAIIDPQAIIHPSVSIGAYSIIGKCKIDEGTVIKEHVHIYDNVDIGRNVILYSSTEIGTEDFGPIMQKDGKIEMFPQIGSLIIEDDVQVFPFTAIGRGTLGATIIKSGVKIDHCCQIGHNAVIGTNSIITANSIILGSSIIGKNGWIGSSSIIKNQIEIGDGVTTGIGSVVTKSIPSGYTVAGNPAVELQQMIQERKTLKRLINNAQADEK